MERCWTCGSRVTSASFRCHYCERSTALGQIEERLSSVDRGIKGGFGHLASLQEKLFEDLGDRFDAGLASLGAVVEWGVQEIVWELDRQSSILSSIDRHIRTPDQTKAREWKEMAAELARRGQRDQAIEYLRKSIKTNPLDYSAYIDLALAEIRLDRFEDAVMPLRNSLPHAPKTELLNYTSYSHRLIGHIRYCQGRIDEALGAIVNALWASQGYSEAFFDLAHYMCLADDETITRVCGDLFRAWGHNWEVAANYSNYDLVRTISLQKAIKARPVYFKIAENHHDLAQWHGLRPYVLDSLIRNLQSRISSKLGRIQDYIQRLGEAIEFEQNDFGFRMARFFSSEAQSRCVVMQSRRADAEKIGRIEHFTNLLQNDSYCQLLLGADEVVKALENIEGLAKG